MKNKNKKFDSVEMMREIRDKLSHEYKSDPEKEDKDLERIRKKYNISPNISMVSEPK